MRLRKKSNIGFFSCCALDHIIYLYEVNMHSRRDQIRLGSQRSSKDLWCLETEKTLGLIILVYFSFVFSGWHVVYQSVLKQMLTEVTEVSGGLTDR